MGSSLMAGLHRHVQFCPHKWDSVVYSSSSELEFSHSTCWCWGVSLYFSTLNLNTLPRAEQLYSPKLTRLLHSDTQETGEQVLYTSSWVAPLDKRLWEPRHRVREQDSVFLWFGWQPVMVHLLWSLTKTCQHVTRWEKEEKVLIFQPDGFWSVARNILIGTSIRGITHVAGLRQEGMWNESGFQ